MKKIVPFFIFILIIVSSCEKTSRDVIFKINDDLEYKYSDIEMYDSSSHILYFKSEHDEIKNLEKGTFAMLDDGEPVYSGRIWSALSSAAPTGPFIMTPSLYSSYMLHFEEWQPDKSDNRNNPRVISLFSRHNLLHSGLAITAGSVEIPGGTQLIFRFTLTNKDQSDLLILDINKTGQELFHYFTNGLYIFDSSDNTVFSSSITAQQPTPWNGWSSEWLSTIKSGESKDFTISYVLDKTLAAGEYKILFYFPGFEFQVPCDQLYQGGSRIWMGSVSFKKHIAIP